MKRTLLSSLIVVLLIFTILLAGCPSDGVSQDLYDGVVEQLNSAREAITELQGEIEELETAKEGVEEDLQAAESTIAELQTRVSEMAGQYDLTGATTLDTVVNIIEYYHDTHLYSKADLFVCSDMASEVWSMLKAQGIDALIVVGDKERAISDIIQSTHAWLLAEVEPGKYLALETTGGYAVYENENPLYYRGWAFDSPADMKSYNTLVREYNVRVEIRNEIAGEVNIAAEAYNQSTNQAEADRLWAVYEKLVEIKDSLEADILEIEAEINSLATVLT